MGSENGHRGHKNGNNQLPLTPKEHRRLKEWATTFRRTDPRFQILHFFNNVAQQDANDTKELERSGVKSLSYFSNKAMKNPIVSSVRASYVSDGLLTHPGELLKKQPASCFSVWRPTSRDALRYMMLGVAVGKGLDIKGKSAKKGRLSAFVPFLQIHKDEHVPMIKIKSVEERNGPKIRVFFSTEERQLQAKALLEEVQCELQGTSGITMEVINAYAPKCYGLVVPEQVLWEGLVIRSPTGISREPGTAGEPYVTGRPSVPQFQDMNLDALRKPHLPHTPRLVLWQFDDEQAEYDDPCNPLTLLMAYEEEKFKRVLPVVSDLDCFLIGTRGVNYEEPLPSDQQKVLEWSIDQIEGILASQQQQRAFKSWTQKWLDVLKTSAIKKGFKPKIPALGFSDPKTKLIMKNAITRLSETGAVRHGAECFNFYFPQDLDDEFLVISDYLPGQELSWTYVDTYGLMGILSEKLDHGYTFPLNPKWVLCDDPGWKILWDKLMASDEANTRGALSAWYPNDIRQKIEHICQMHPHGFIVPEPYETAAPAAAAAAAPASSIQDDDDMTYRDMDAEMAMELANYELIQYLMDLDKAEKQKEKDRRDKAMGKDSKQAVRPGVYKMESVAPAGKRGAYTSAPDSKPSESASAAFSERTESRTAAVRPGAFQSYTDVAASKQSWASGTEAPQIAPEPAPLNNQRNVDPLSDPAVANVNSLVESMQGMPDVVVDILSTSMNDHNEHELMQRYVIEQFCNLLINEDKTQIKGLLVTQGVDVDTILMMKTFGQSLPIQEQGCKFLWFLSDETGGGNSINATSRIVAVSRVVDALKWFVSAKPNGDENGEGTDFVRYALGTLCNLVLDKKASKIFKSLDGGQSVVVEAMGFYLPNADIQLDGITILASSSTLPENEQTATKMIEGVSLALGQHYMSCQNDGRSVASGACRAFAKWIDEEPYISLLKQQPNTSEYLKFIMDNAAESKCRKKAISVLEELLDEEVTPAPRQRTSRKSKKDESGPKEMLLDDALATLERDSQLSEDVVILCFDALAQHLQHSTTTASEIILTKGGIVTLCRAMKVFEMSMIIQERGCYLLSSMTKLHPKRVLATGVACEALLHAIWCHKNINAMQRLSLSAILDLSVDFDCWFQIQQNGQMDFLQELIYNTEDTEAAELGIAILTNFSNFGM